MPKQKFGCNVPEYIPGLRAKICRVGFLLTKAYGSCGSDTVNTTNPDCARRDCAVGEYAFCLFLLIAILQKALFTGCYNFNAFFVIFKWLKYGG